MKNEPTRIFAKSRPGERRRRQKICALFIAPEAIPDDNMEAMAIKENRQGDRTVMEKIGM